jgi:murein DD-endopeptidase MepM/ murein hydrolase activator NlpD
MHHIHVCAHRTLARLEEALSRHPRRLTAALAALLLGSAVTAFGVAVPSPQAADKITTRIITEAVPMAEDLAEQLAALEEQALTLNRSGLTRAGDTADSLLARLGIDDPQAAQLLRHDPVAQQILQGRPGKLLQSSTERDASGTARLQQLVVRGPAADSSTQERLFTRITVQRDAGQLVARSEQVALEHAVQQGSGTIDRSLFAAADEARIPDAITMQLADIFGSEIDFRRDLRRGDTFAVLYESLSADGEPITWGNGNGRVLSARFVNQGDTHEAIWFEPPGSHGGYYGPDGKSKAHTFLASPLAFSRVTSGFAMRLHPILQTWRAHLGIDYGAPSGTPVRAIGDGQVEFAGWQNGYGNVIQLRHGSSRSTVYAHLSRIGVKTGERITQGQTIGAVGATGWATGPHLHFEVKVDGRQVDPVKLARTSETVALVASAKPLFDQTLHDAQALLAHAQRPAVRLARME